MAFSLSTTAPTTLKDYLGGDGGQSGDVVNTYPIAASTSILKGQFLMISGGYVTPCTATTDVAIGIATKAVDNSSGAAGALNASVLQRGAHKCNLFVAKSGDTYGTAAAPGLKVGLSTNGVTGMVGQSVSCGTDPTVFVGKCLSTQALPVSSTVYLGLVYFDFLSNA